MGAFYPEIEPYACGRLDVGDGNSMYWECCGNPDGTPALYVHGGPGSGCTPAARRYFDPDKYRIMLFDQRGCRSEPSAVSRPCAVQGQHDAAPHTRHGVAARGPAH